MYVVRNQQCPPWIEVFVETCLLCFVYKFSATIEVSELDIMAEQYKLIHPVKYYRDYLNHNIRPDGREFLEFRKVNVDTGHIGTADGSAIAKIGKSNVLCGIRAELAKPKNSEPDQGFLVPHLEISSVSSPKFKAGSSNEDAEVLTCCLYNVLTSSECINLTDLCIAKDKWVWCLYCDVICISHDGCILDAAVIAVISALKNLKLPSVEYDPELDIVSVNQNIKRTLEIHTIPISTTFIIFDNKTFILDPTSEEENLSSSIITIAVCDSDVCYIYKPGGTPLSFGEMQKCIEKGFQRQKSVLDLINRALQDKK